MEQRLLEGQKEEGYQKDGDARRRVDAGCYFNDLALVCECFQGPALRPLLTASPSASTFAFAFPPAVVPVSAGPVLDLRSSRQRCRASANEHHADAGADG